MIIEIDFDFILKHKLTAEQYLLMWLLYEDEKERERRALDPLAEHKPYLQNVYKYHVKISNFSKLEVQELVERGFIDFIGTATSKKTPDMYRVTDKFSNEIFNHWTNFDQLKHIYPDRAVFEPGKPAVSLKSFDRLEEEIAKIYEGSVRTKKKHNRILELVDWGKKTGRIKMGLQKFVFSKHWEMLEQEYSEGSVVEDSNQHMI